MPPRPAKADFNIHVTLTYSVACEPRNSDQDEAEERKLFNPHDTYVEYGVQHYFKLRSGRLHWNERGPVVAHKYVDSAILQGFSVSRYSNC